MLYHRLSFVVLKPFFCKKPFIINLDINCRVTLKAVQANFLSFLQGTKQFVIPIYQRNYSWTLKQCEQLWNDITRTALSPEIPGHFIGSIVYIESGVYQVSSVPQLLVIDGQQRLTTLSLYKVSPKSPRYQHHRASLQYPC